jgi:DNA polymerase I-like protein with 3'-5' exonuclease and polymerase domains
MNTTLRLAVRNAVCTDCKMSKGLDGDDVCHTGTGPNGATVGVVTQFPIAPDSKMRVAMAAALSEVGIEPDQVMWLSAIKCRTWSAVPSKGDLKACRPYLDKELAALGLTHVLALGSEALFAATGRSGVVKWRGQVYTHPAGTVVYPTISPAMVSRNPGMGDGFAADLRYFGNLVRGVSVEDDPWHLPYDDQWTIVDTTDGVREMCASLKTADAVSYDIETNCADENDVDAAIVSLALTTLHGDDPHVWVMPLYHPEGPWHDGGKWKILLYRIRNFLCQVPIRVAHNAKFDTRWLVHFGMPDLFPTFDTIIAASLLDENRRKGLKPLAQQLLGADPWAIDARLAYVTPWETLADYNGLDTWHTMRLYLLFRKQLRAQPRLARLFTRLMMPVVQELVHVERRGVYVDRPLMMSNWTLVQARLAEIEAELADFLPDPDDVPDKFKHKKTGEVLVNYNASGFLRWWLFDHLDLPVLARGKVKEDGSPGDPSVAEAVMSMLADQSPVAKLLVDRVEWNKYDTSFFGPYSNQITADDRIRSVFKPWGTVTGRMSSGKEDAEKVTGRQQIRGVNMQQVPRNKLVRGVFGAAPGWSFVEADYSQIELRIAAFLAREPTMLRLYATGQDIHMATAMQMTGKAAKDVTSEERKKAKAVNFGFLYGMGWAKFIATAWANYGVVVTEAEAKAFRAAFFQQFKGLLPWHARQRKLATQYKRVETPMGRVRHLPDIDSVHPEVRSEAERQAINSPVQAMASDMALLSLVHTARRFRSEGIQAYPIAAIHDAVNFEILDEDLPHALPIIKEIMETLPLDRLFGVHVDVPIIADLKVGAHWGGATEIPAAVLADEESIIGWLADQERIRAAA